MVNGPDPSSSAKTHPDAASDTKSSPPAANGKSAIGPAGTDSERINLPASQETPPQPVRTPSEFVGLRRGMDVLQVLMVLILAFFCASFAIRNSDFFLSLASGRALTQGTYQFGVDPYSYTTEGQYWVNHSWLYDLGLYHVFNWVGGPGLVVIKAIAVTLLAIVLLQIRRKDQGIWIPTLCIGLAVLALSPRLAMQPVLLSYLFLGLTLYLLTYRSEAGSIAGTGKTEAEKPPRIGLRSLALILLVALWANVDAWFILGPITIGLFLLGEVVQALLAPVVPGEESAHTRERQGLAVAFVGSLVVCLLNPHFYRVFELPVELAFGVPAEVKQSPLFAPIFQSPWAREYWKASESGWNVAGFAYFPLVLLSLLSFIANTGNFRWWRLLVWGAFLVATALRSRMIPFFAVVSGPIMALNFQDFAVAYWPKLKERTSGHVGWLVGLRMLTFLLLLGLVACAWPGLLQAAPYEVRHVNWVLESDQSLERAALKLDEMHQNGLIHEGERGFTLSQEFGYYCAWYCPREKNFVDYRISLYPAAVWQEFFKLRSTIRPSSPTPEMPTDDAVLRENANIKQEFFRKWDVNHVTYLYEGNPLESRQLFWELAVDSKQWTMLALQGRTAIFGWKDPQSPERPDRFGKYAYDADREAFGPASNNILPPQPLPQTERREEWIESALKLAYARPLRSVDSDEASLHLVHGEILNILATQRYQHSIVARQTAMACGFAGGMPAPTCMLTYCLVILPTMGYPVNAQSPPQPAAPYLAIRAARRAIAYNPDDATAYLNLAKAYRSLPEGISWKDSNDPGFLVAGMRRCQMAAALQAAVTVDPDSFDAHHMLFEYYGGEVFNYQAGLRGPRNQGAVFVDLALKHLTRCVEILRARNRKEARAALEDFEAKQKELEQRVHEAKNKWLVQTQAPNLPVLEKAMQAGYMGLAGEALTKLQQSTPDELRSMDRPPQEDDSDRDGVRIQLDLMLRCGKTMDVREALYTNESQIPSNPRLKVMGRIRLPCFKWIAVQYAAAVGDFDGADAILKDMIEEARQLNLQQLGKAAAFFLGITGVKQPDSASLPAMLMMRVPGPKPIALACIERMNAYGNLEGYRLISPVARSEADLSVLRGLLALETGDTKSAREHFDHAHDLAIPPAAYLKTMANFGLTNPLTCIACAAVENHLQTGYAFGYPLQELNNYYLTLMAAQDKTK